MENDEDMIEEITQGLNLENPLKLLQFELTSSKNSENGVLNLNFR